MNEIFPFVTRWMDLQGSMPSEISQRKRKTHTLKFLLSLEFKNKSTKAPRYPSYRKSIGHCQRCVWEVKQMGKFFFYSF